MNADVRLLITADGSHTAVNQTLDKTYHSIHGAYQESQRVYIELGLLEAFNRFPDQELYVFEMGFGTGLNALLTAQQALNHQRRVIYTTIEAYPMSLDDAQRLNYDELLGTDYLGKLHGAPWNQLTSINPYFSLLKFNSTLQEWSTSEAFHLMYYDAFAPTAQPELWEPEIFAKLAHLLLPNGLLTTYCSKSYVQRNLRSAGLTVEKHPGPPHKRDILRAVRSLS
ncbi:tRNA (5-methylaminomethyl-2-thiouridine)(34)-methyltransferase MnmC2 [Spirosoma gilvum]